MDGALPACSARHRESDYLCVTNTHLGQKCEGVHVCVSGRCIRERVQDASEATYEGA